MYSYSSTLITGVKICYGGHRYVIQHSHDTDPTNKIAVFSHHRVLQGDVALCWGQKLNRVQLFCGKLPCFLLFLFVNLTSAESH